MTAIIIISALAISLVTTYCVRYYALERGVLDIPNVRSSHNIPTPRGGGLGIVAGVLAAAPALLVLGIPARFLIGLCGGAALVAAVGWIDDHRSVSPRLRLVVHFAAALGLVASVGGVETLRFGNLVLSGGPLVATLSVLLLVWLINLFNFMDGTDALAATEAAQIGLIAGGISWFLGDRAMALLCWIMAAAAVGFLRFNWPPASIFLGDAGSGALGFLIGGLAIISEIRGGLSLVMWVVLAGAFVADATTTLVRRALAGETWYAAHRRHAYQRLVQFGWSHRRLAIGVIALNLVLAALVLVAVVRPELTFAVVLSSALLLALMYVWVERKHPF